MKDLLIITRGQFGTLTDTYQYCKYLRNEYRISYICFDEGNPKIYLSGITVHYVSYKGYRMIKGIRFILSVVRHVLYCDGTIFMVYFSQCEWVQRILFQKKIHLDIRTLSVKDKEGERINENAKIKHACQYFKSISLINRKLNDYLQIPEERLYLLPLGADRIASVMQKDYQQMHLLYVGVLNHRNILDTVKGLHLYLKEYPETILTYDIVGDGEEFELIWKYVTDNHLGSIIKMHGRVLYDQLEPFFNSCNIGISYIPICDYYQHQPVTKTYEYLMSGLYCIATDTIENRKVISQHTGMLIDSNSMEFAKALSNFQQIKSSLNYSYIQNSLSSYQWGAIIRNYLLPIIQPIER